MKKNLIIFLAITLTSCNNTVKKLSNLYGKELSTPPPHFGASNKLTINKDSTFEYKDGSYPAVGYAKGYWRLNADKSGIILKTINEDNHDIGKPILDTIFLSLNGRLVKIKNKTTVEMRGELFRVPSNGQ
jgi:hypothetical protein